MVRNGERNYFLLSAYDGFTPDVGTMDAVCTYSNVEDLLGNEEQWDQPSNGKIIAHFTLV